MIAAKTTVPVLGVPVAGRHLQGVDSLHSIVQIARASRSRPARSAPARMPRSPSQCSRPRTPDCASDCGLPGAADRGRPQRPFPRAHDDGGDRTRSDPRCDGGPVARMFVHAARGLRRSSAGPRRPAGRVSHRHVHADYLDHKVSPNWRTSARPSTEFENVPSAALADIALWVPVAPAAEAVAIAQDRAREKAHFTRHRRRMRGSRSSKRCGTRSFDARCPSSRPLASAMTARASSG